MWYLSTVRDALNRKHYIFDVLYCTIKRYAWSRREKVSKHVHSLYSLDGETMWSWLDIFFNIFFSSWRPCHRFWQCVFYFGESVATTFSGQTYLTTTKRKTGACFGSFRRLAMSVVHTHVNNIKDFLVHFVCSPVYLSLAHTCPCMIVWNYTHLSFCLGYY